MTKHTWEEVSSFKEVHTFECSKCECICTIISKSRRPTLPSPDLKLRNLDCMETIIKKTLDE